MQPAPPPPLRGFGQPAPMFIGATDDIPRFNFSAVGGRWVVLAFFGSLSFAASQAGHRAAMARRGVFDDTGAALFGVSVDPADKSERGLNDEEPGIHYFRDYDGAISRAYGVAPEGAYTPTVFLLDPMLRIVASEPIDQFDRLLDTLARVRADDAPEWAGMSAPVLTVPRIFEREFCETLIAYYERQGGADSGVMRTAAGMTVGVLDNVFKRRRDVYLDGDALLAQARARLEERLLPMIGRAFGWQATRIERYLVSCYDGAERGMFLPHRDNTTAATAHRKFAVTINLNDGYEGGALRFPEFGPRTYRPSVGGAVVFGCSLLHEVTPVESGVRYAFIPFLYDEAGAAVREANLHRLSLAPAQAAAPVRGT